MLIVDSSTILAINHQSSISNQQGITNQRSLIINALKGILEPCPEEVVGLAVQDGHQEPHEEKAGERQRPRHHRLLALEMHEEERYERGLDRRDRQRQDNGLDLGKL